MKRHSAPLEVQYSTVPFSFFTEVKLFRFGPKTMDYSPWFDFWESKKVFRKVCHSKGGWKETLVSVA